MTYLDIANMTDSGSLIRRLSAAAAEQANAGATLDPSDPMSWVGEHRWELVAAPGWADAWASAIASGSLDPGGDPAVITDPMILSQVQAVLAG